MTVRAEDAYRQNDRVEVIMGEYDGARGIILMAIFHNGDFYYQVRLDTGNQQRFRHADLKRIPQEFKP